MPERTFQQRPAAKAAPKAATALRGGSREESSQDHSIRLVRNGTSSAPPPAWNGASGFGHSIQHLPAFSPAPLSIQPKLKINQPGDRYEQEADRVADMVIRMPEPALQRKCACGGTCDKCKGGHGDKEHGLLQMKRVDASALGPEEAPTIVHDALKEPGQPLDEPTRRFMEPRFGHDLSTIRIHTGSLATASTAATRAKAYTVGNHIVFGPGRAAFGTNAGLGLLAHELTHAAQQQGMAKAIQRDGEEGTSEFRDTARTHSRDADGVVRGSVRREELVPATATEAEVSLNDQTVPVEFNENTCTVSLRHNYAFVAGRSTEAEICGGPSAGATPVGAARLAEIRTQYLQAVNNGLNGWYAVRMEGDGCTTCAGRDIPIRVVATANSGPADTTITVVNAGGRADAGTICADNFEASTNRHEGGHQVLGLGDEYPEEDPTTLARVPGWGRPERIRDDDYSAMGPQQHTRFALFHERHFNHVPTFLRAVYPNCEVELVELSRPVLPEFRFTLSPGYAYLDGGHGYYLELGLGMGIPLTRLREWQVTLMATGGIMGTADISGMQAWMAGARAGLEYTDTPSDGGLRAGLFAGGGYLAPLIGDVGDGAPYMEGGGRFGYRTGHPLPFFIGAEVAGGSTLTPFSLPDDLPGDERTRAWFRSGLIFAIEH